MAVEIERKFLVRGDTWRVAADGGTPVVQGYLADDGNLSVRVRRKGETYLLTIKADREAGGRWEYEYEIPADDAGGMLDLCTAAPIEKVRHLLQAGALTWEIDVFGGANQGLVIAEVELPDTNTEVALPEWIGKEVTDDPRYLNSNLYRTPFRDW